MRMHVVMDYLFSVLYSMPLFDSLITSGVMVNNAARALGKELAVFMLSIYVRVDKILICSPFVHH